MRKLLVLQIMQKRALLLAPLFLLVALAPIPAGATTPRSHTFRVEAGKFEYSPAVLSVNPGDHVTIELVSTDVVHGIFIDGYDLELSADPGQTQRMKFIADRVGSFRFRCSVTCGPLHPFMIGKLYVGRNLLFWRAAGMAILAAFAIPWLVRK